MAEALTWDELRKLPDRTPIYIDMGHRHPYACVLRWDFTELGWEACMCAFDPATMDDALVVARFSRARFERTRPRIWKRGS